MQSDKELREQSQRNLWLFFLCCASILLVAPHVRTALHVNMTACSAVWRWTYTQMLQNY